MADAHGIKLFGTTIAIKEIRQVIKDEVAKDHDQTIEKRPDKIIQCPRCKSMETKFCYFNNYNVNQPRHFCKGCQRYWTAGGVLRNVPVGAGRRKTKPPCSGITGFGQSCLFDSSGISRFDFDEIVEDVFPGKRRRNTSCDVTREQSYG